MTEASAKRPDDAELLYYIGAVHYQLNDWTKCNETLARAVSLTLPPDLAEQATRTLAECAQNAPHQR